MGVGSVRDVGWEVGLARVIGLGLDWPEWLGWGWD